MREGRLGRQEASEWGIVAVARSFAGSSEVEIPEFEKAFESFSFWIHGKCYNLLPFFLWQRLFSSRGLRVFWGFRFPQISLTYFSASFFSGFQFAKPKIRQCCISIGFVVDLKKKVAIFFLRCVCFLFCLWYLLEWTSEEAIFLRKSLFFGSWVLQVCQVVRWVIWGGVLVPINWRFDPWDNKTHSREYSFVVVVVVGDKEGN